MNEHNDTEPPLRLCVSVGETTVEVEGPVDTAREQFSALREEFLVETSRSTKTNQNTQAESASSETRQKQRSLGEFYQRVDNPTKQDTTLLTSWYSEQHDGLSDFTRTEIESTATDSKLTLGENVPRDIRNLVKKGYMAENDTRDGETTYIVTIDGEEYVEDELLNTEVD